jgi:accessory gene regulator protein AgrB
METLEHLLGICGESHINIYWVLFFVIISYIFFKIKINNGT